jgi:hypothetical protein
MQYRVLVEKAGGKGPLGRPTCRWEDNIKINLRKVEFGRSYLDLSGSGQGKVAGFCECGIEPKVSMNCG